jgi:aminotransferase
VFESNWIGKGRQVSDFEKGFADYINAGHENVKSISCCTEGLFEILEILNIKEGDEVILPSISFIGAGNAVANTGAKPVFCDVDKRTLNVKLDNIVEKITPKTKAVIILHYGGLPCEIDVISDYLRENGIYLIEDSACSVASKFNGRHCGTFGDFGVWSFDAMKILIIGDGGAVYAKNTGHAKQIEYHSYLGLKSKSGIENTVDKKWWEFDIDHFGRRAIINDIAGAIGNSQLKKLNQFIKTRKGIHDFYDAELGSLGWLMIPDKFPANIESSYYFYWLQFEKEGLRDRLAMFLRENGIYTTFRYYPLHWVNYFQDKSILVNTEWAARNTLCIPIHQGLTQNDLEIVVSKIKEFGD